MEYYVLSPPEASGLYLGLQLQAMLRSSPLRWLPYLLFTLGGFHLLWKEFTWPHTWAARPWVVFGGYVGTCLLLMALFWPEASVFGHSRRLSAQQVASYAATQSPEATVITAHDTGDIVEDGVLETEGFRVLLQFLTSTPLAIARATNPEAGRVFRPLLSTSMLLGVELPAEVSRAITDWVEACWKPAMVTTRDWAPGISAQDLLPWGGTPMEETLKTREVIPGSQVGSAFGAASMAFLANPGPSRETPCNIYLSRIEMETQRLLFVTPTPAGIPFSQAFQEDLGKDVAWQARFLVYRAILGALGRPSPAPSLGAAYAGLSGAHAVAGAAGGLLGGRGSPGLGALLGAGAGVVNQFDAAIQKLLLAVGVAAWFLYFSPILSGLALQFLVGLFPIAFCYTMIPGTPWRPLLLYFLGLLYVLSMPLWLALVELGARNASHFAPQSDDILLSLFNWAPALTYYAVATVGGLLLIFGLAAGVIFQQSRGLVASWRS